MLLSLGAFHLPGGIASQHKAAPRPTQYLSKSFSTMLLLSQFLVSVSSMMLLWPAY